jgi:hypothetical protein
MPLGNLKDTLLEPSLAKQTWILTSILSPGKKGWNKASTSTPAANKEEWAIYL